jgi:hypothetical protein
MAVQALAGLGHLDAAGGAPHQLHPGSPLHLGQVVAHVGPAHAPFARGLAQASGIDDIHQQQQGVGIQHCSIQFDGVFTFVGIVK